MSINKLDIFSFSRTVLVYRLTPEVSLSGAQGNLLSPFSNTVWICTVLCIILIVISLSFIQYVLSRMKYDKRISLMLSTVFTIGAFCQQGIEPAPRANSGRIIILNLMITSVVLYNYYTSSVVGGLLSSLPKGPSNLRELIDSGMSFTFENLGYNKAIFNPPPNKMVADLYEKRVLAKRKPHEPPVFVSTKEAIPYIYKGGVVFQSETNLIYPEIYRAFTANEICDLRILNGFVESDILWFLQPKFSMYTEMFKIE